MGVYVGECVKSRESIRAELVAQVRARAPELEQVVFARVRDGAQSPAGEGDAEYMAGLRAAVVAAIEHALLGIESGGRLSGTVPPEAAAQAHRAARAGVSLDTVLRRYVLGSTLLGDFLMQEAGREDSVAQGAVLREALNVQASVLDSLMAAITSEYRREQERVHRSPEQRRTESVLGLLAGHHETTELGYEFEGWHVAAIATGAAAVEALRHVATGLGARLLCVARGDRTAWGWFGGQRKIDARRIERLLCGVSGGQPDGDPSRAASESRLNRWNGSRDLDRMLGDVGAGDGRISLALGEPAVGVEGWRLSHRQAQAALSVVLRRPRLLTRYADVALLASVLRDEVLADSLVEMYLVPLGDLGNGGRVLRETLRTYFAVERNASSAASVLGVARHTVENRLRTVEDKLGEKLRTRQAELEVALRLEELRVDAEKQSVDV